MPSSHARLAASSRCHGLKKSHGAENKILGTYLILTAAATSKKQQPCRMHLYTVTSEHSTFHKRATVWDCTHLIAVNLILTLICCPACPFNFQENTANAMDNAAYRNVAYSEVEITPNTSRKFRTHGGRSSEAARWESFRGRWTLKKNEGWHRQNLCEPNHYVQKRSQACVTARNHSLTIFPCVGAAVTLVLQLSRKAQHVILHGRLYLSWTGKSAPYFMSSSVSGP